MTCHGVATSRELVCRKEDCSSFDIGTVYRVIASFTDAEKFRLIESAWVFFGIECGKNGAKLDKLFRSPLTFWTTAHGRFDSHSGGKSEIHKFSVMAMQNFLAAMRRKTAPIDQQLNRLMQAHIDENREKINEMIALMTAIS